jgi:hypothetical protein
MKKYKKIFMALSIISGIIAGCFGWAWLLDGMLFVQQQPNPSFDFWKTFLWHIKTAFIIGWFIMSIWLYNYSEKL